MDPIVATVFFTLGLLVAAVAALAVLGIAVTIFRWVQTPPPPPPPATTGFCVGCAAMQALWDNMTFLEKAMAFPSYTAASYLCEIAGCPRLLLI
jgi:hypothetical protein